MPSTIDYMSSIVKNSQLWARAACFTDIKTSPTTSSMRADLTISFLPCYPLMPAPSSRRSHHPHKGSSGAAATKNTSTPLQPSAASTGGKRPPQLEIDLPAERRIRRTLNLVSRLCSKVWWLHGMMLTEWENAGIPWGMASVFAWYALYGMALISVALSGIFP